MASVALKCKKTYREATWKATFLSFFLCGVAATIVLIVGIATTINRECPCHDHGICCVENVDDSIPIDCNGECVCFSQGTAQCLAKTWDMPVWGKVLLIVVGTIGVVGAIGWGIFSAKETWDSFGNGECGEQDEHDRKEVKMSHTTIMDACHHNVLGII